MALCANANPSTWECSGGTEQDAVPGLTICVTCLEHDDWAGYFVVVEP